MVLVDKVTTTEVLAYKGLHLFHFGESTCCQKVRMVLALKGADWTSHVVDMISHENKTEWFLGVNPRGLVPVLVDDGQVIVESNDIVKWLDEKFPPSSDFDGSEEDSLHLSMRTLTFTFAIPSRLATPPKEKMASYEKYGGGVGGPGQDFKEQIDFWNEYAENKGCPPDKVVKAYDDVHRTLGNIQLPHSFFGGDEPSLADIVWFPTINRLENCGINLGKHHPLLADWLDRCRKLPAVAAEKKYWQKSWLTTFYQTLFLREDLDTAVARMRSSISSEQK